MTINGIPIISKVWMGEKVLFCSDISKIHHIGPSTPRSLMCKYIRINHRELKEYHDFFLIPAEQCRYYWNIKMPSKTQVFAFTKSGYQKLVSVMDSDTALDANAVFESGYFDNEEDPRS